MKIDYLTLFPEMFDGVLNHSIMKRAQKTINYKSIRLILEIMQLTSTTK